MVEAKGHDHSHDLPYNCGDGGAGNLQTGKAKETEDHDRVQDDIDDGAGPLGDHIVKGSSRGLQKTLEGDLQEDPYGKQSDDGHILNAVLQDHRIVCLKGEKEAGAHKSQQREDDAAYDGQEHPVPCRIVGAFKIPFPQVPGEQGIDTYAGSGSHGDHERLDRECQRDRGQGVLA